MDSEHISTGFTEGGERLSPLSAGWAARTLTEHKGQTHLHWPGSPQ